MSYQFSNIKALGDNLYFPFIVTRTGGEIPGFSYSSREELISELNEVEAPPELRQQLLAKYDLQNASIERNIFLNSYSEVFESNWSEIDRAFGRLNPDFRYVNTVRKLTMSFTLPAKNVAESKANLDFCSGLARVVYGNYTTSYEKDTFGQIIYNFQGASYNTRVKFGNLLRNELCQFTDFSFKPNFDSGVFEYSDANVEDAGTTLGKLQDDLWNSNRNDISELQYVYHNQKGKVYPKEINVDVSALIFHDYPLGFGGLRRPGQPLSWAENENRDWPHGTGPTYPVLSYMASQDLPIEASPETVEADDGVGRVTRDPMNQIENGTLRTGPRGRAFEVEIGPDGQPKIIFLD